MTALVPWLVFLHVFSAIVAFGPTFAFAIYGAQAGKEPQHANFMARANHVVSDRLVLPVVLSMPVTGLLIVWAAGIPLLDTRWLLVAIVIYIGAVLYSRLRAAPGDAQARGADVEPAAARRDGPLARADGDPREDPARRDDPRPGGRPDRLPDGRQADVLMAAEPAT